VSVATLIKQLAKGTKEVRDAKEVKQSKLEANPSPGFTYCEALTGQPIADTIASWLARSWQLAQLTWKLRNLRKR
jgi:hypothetical protein